MNTPSTRPLAAFLTRLIWLSVLPPVLTATWLASTTVLSQQQATRQQALLTAKNFSTSIDNFLNDRMRALNILAVSPLADDPQHWQELYKEAQGFFESYGSHVILADTGDPMRMLFNTRIAFDAPLPPLPKPKGDAAAPKALATARPAVGDAFMGPIAKEPLVAIVVPGIRHGKVTHLLLSILETKQLQQRLEQEAVPAEWSLTLQDGKGEVIARRSPAQFDARRDVDDQGRFMVHSTLSPWTVVLEIPRTALHTPLLAAGFGLGMAILLATLAGVFGGTWAGRRLSRQVASLTAPPTSIGPSLDITEIANARTLLDDAAASQRLNESRYQAIFEHASIGIAQVSLEGVCVQVNRAVCTMFGYSPEEFRTTTWQQLTAEDERAIDLAFIDRLLAGEMDSYTREKRFIARDGSTFWANLGVTLIRDPEHTPDYFIAIVEHIQARKAAEAALAKSEQRYRQLVENANSVILHWAPDGAIVFINEYGQETFGWKAEEIVGQPVGRLLPERESTGTDLSNLVEEIAACPERFQRNINENVRRDGSRIWMSWTNTVLVDENDRIAGILSIGSDITEHKQLLEELKQRNEELERFDQASVGREMQMIALKRQINELSQQLGHPPPFDLSFSEVAP